MTIKESSRKPAIGFDDNILELKDQLSDEAPAESRKEQQVRSVGSGTSGAVVMQSMIELACQRIVGQEQIIRKLVIAFFVGFHALIEGLPGVGKTELVKHLSKLVGGAFYRIQFTPDMLPADIRGTRVWTPAGFDVEVGKIAFANFVLGDEINRAPSKVKAALLDILSEMTITINGHEWTLYEVFMFIGTMNPIEFTGTYPMGEAELDRFPIKIRQPLTTDIETERAIWETNRFNIRSGAADIQLVELEDVVRIRQEIEKMPLTDEVRDYGLNLILATRSHSAVQHAASPRASIALLKMAKGAAYMADRTVSKTDVAEFFPDVVNHRLILEVDAQTNGKTVDDVIADILDTV